MAEYSYRASDFQGKIVEGSIEASEERSVVERLRERGLVPIKIGVASAGGTGRLGRTVRLPSLGGGKRTVRSKDLLIFTRELSTLLAAGIPLDRGLTTLVELSPNAELKRVTGEVLQAVRGGASLAEALGQFPNVFPSLYVNMVKAGEIGGVLDTVLIRLVEYLESAEDLRDEVRTALTYPILLVIVGGLSVVFLLIFVLPKFASMFADMGEALPMSTRIMLSVSDAFSSIWTLPIALVLVGGAYGLYRYADANNRYALDAWKLRMPLVGSLVRRMEVARFSRTLGTLLSSGVPMLQSLDIVRAVSINLVIDQAIGDVQVGVREGVGMSAPLGRSGAFPPLALQMIAVGEDTGKLDEMLVTVADYFDGEVRTQVKQLTSLLEPALIVFMGLVVGFMVISMLTAVFSINDLNV